jgi:trehalose-6-phosphate synthase
MAADERRRRREAIVSHVREHDIGRWIGALLTDLDEAGDRAAVSTAG